MAKRRPPPDRGDDSDIPGGSPQRDPVKFPFGESLDDSDVGGVDPVKFPFGETGERPGARPYGDSLSDIGALDDSDVEAFESSLDLDEDVFGSSEQLPNLPPGSSPGDDASFRSLEEALVEASTSGDDFDPDDSYDGPPLTPSELGDLPISDMGPIGPSGPLVIVDDGGDASTRYQASVVDDSIRIAGSKSVRRPKKRGQPKPKTPPSKRKQPPPDLEQSSEWAEEPLEDDVSVPTPSGRRPRRSARSGRIAAPPPRSSKKLTLVVAVLGVGAAIAVGVIQEQRRLDALHQLEQRSGAELDAAHEERRNAVGQLERQHADALAAEHTQRQGEVEQHKQRIDELETELAVATERADQAEAELTTEKRRAAEALDVELARARREITDEVDEQVRGELEAEHLAALEAERSKASAEQARLEGELSAAQTQVARLKGELEQARLDAQAAQVDDGEWGDPGWDDEGEGGGEEDGGGGDDWDQFFEDSSDDAQPDDEVADDDEPNPLAKLWSWFQDEVPIHGSLAYKNLTHFSTGPPGNDLQRVRNEFRALVNYKGWLYQSSDRSAGVRLVAGLDIKYDDDEYTEGAFMRSLDDEEDKRPVVLPDEAYLALSYDVFTFRGGYQKYAWGTGDLYNPTDNVNPIDYSDLFDPREMPVLAYTVALDFETVSLELIGVPTFTRSRLPLQGQRFDILADAVAPVLAPDDPENEIQNAQLAGKVAVRKFGWDVTLSGYTGFDSIPAGQVAVSSVFPIVGQVQTEFNKIHVLGLDFATTLGFLGLKGAVGDLLAGIQLHGEGAHVWYEGELSDDLVQYVFGFNYQFVDVIGEQDFTLIVEYAGELETHKAEQPLPGVTLSRIFQSAWLARLVYDPHEDVSVAINVAWLVHGPDSLYVHPEATWNITDYLELVVSGDVFTGSKDTFFGQFKHNGRFMGQVRVLF